MSHDFVGLAHEHDRVSDFEAAVLESLRRSIGFDAGFFLVAGQEQHLTSTGLDARTVGLLRDRNARYAEELLPVKEAALRARGVAVDTRVLGERRVRRSRYFRDVAASVSGRHGLLGYLQKGRSPFGVVILGRSGSDFSESEVAWMERQLSTLSLARAAFSVPYCAAPLRAPPAWTLLRRADRDLERTASQREHIVVRDRADYREMVASDGHDDLVWTRSKRARPSRSGWPYADLLHLAAARAGARRRALFIGCGGAVGLHRFAEVYPGMELDVVEREATVVELAERWFDLARVPRLTVHVADGLDFVRRAAPNRWDVVVLDAFDASSSDSGFASEAFLTDLHRVLQPGGAFACNLIGTLAGEGLVSTFAHRAAQRFDAVRIVPVMETDEAFSPHARRNVVVVAVRAE